MKTTEKTEKLDEIVFSGRNTEYGAYKIRKDYSGNVNKAMMITITLFLMGIAVPLIASYYNRINPVKPGGDVIYVMDDLNKPKDDEIKPPLPELPDEQYKEQIRNLAPEVVPPDMIDTTIVWSMDPPAVNPPIDTTLTVTREVPRPVILDPVIETPVHLIVQEMPSFPGGEEARLKFLHDNLQYPFIAREAGIQGPVYLTFIVDEAGNITHLEVARGIGAGCDEEALRVMKAMPRWNPGKQDNKAVRVKYSMKVLFTLL